MNKYIKYTIVVLVLYSVLSTVLFNNKISRIKTEQNNVLKQQIKQSDERQTLRIDSLISLINKLEILRAETVLKTAELEAKAKQLEQNQKYILYKFKTKQNEIINSSDTADWDWFKRRFTDF